MVAQSYYSGSPLDGSPKSSKHRKQKRSKHMDQRTRAAVDKLCRDPLERVHLTKLSLRTRCSLEFQPHLSCPYFTLNLLCITMRYTIFSSPLARTRKSSSHMLPSIFSSFCSPSLIRFYRSFSIAFFIPSSSCSYALLVTLSCSTASASFPRLITYARVRDETRGRLPRICELYRSSRDAYKITETFRIDFFSSS